MSVVGTLGVTGGDQTNVPTRNLMASPETELVFNFTSTKTSVEYKEESFLCLDSSLATLPVG